jgi:hypothetical protein
MGSLEDKKFNVFQGGILFLNLITFHRENGYNIYE